MKKYFFLLMLTCCMVLITACSSNDDIPVTPPENSQSSWTPEEQQFAKQVIGTWCDFDETNSGIASEYLIYDVQENGVFDLWTLWFNPEANSEDDFEEDVFHGSWKPILNISDRWTNEGTLNGIEVNLDPEGLGLEPGTEVKDTLLYIDLGSEGNTLFWTSDLDAALAYYNSLSPEEQAKLDNGTRTRGVIGWIWQRITNVGQNITNVVKTVAQPVRMIIRKIQGKDASYASGMSDWMGNIYNGKDPRICDMSIPGTHDSFTYPEMLKNAQCWYTIPGVNLAMVRKVKTQGLTIEKQWDAGVRCFDVRLDDFTALTSSLNLTKVLGIFHGFVYLGLTFDQGIDKIADLVKAHKDETAIVILKFEGNGSEKYYREIYNKVEELRRAGLVVENPSPGMRLSQCRGKIIFIQRYGDNSYNLDVRASDWNENSKLIFMNNPENTAPLHVQDLYESNGDEFEFTFIDRKKKTMEECFIASSSSTDNTWFFNHSSCYHGMTAFGLNFLKFLDMNYAEEAHYINPWLADYVKDHQGKKTGVVVSDFSGTDELSDGLFFTRGIDVPINLIENNKYLP